MRKLSVWAKHHPAYARIIIVISRCLLVLIGYFLGTQLIKSGNQLSPLWIYFFIGIFFITAASYPSDRSSKTYTKRKWNDLVVASCGFLIVVSMSNQLNKLFSVYENAYATKTIEPSRYKNPQAEKLLEQYKSGEKKTFSAKEKRIIKNEFKYQLGQYAKAKITGNKKEGDEVALIILACIAAVGLFFLLAGLACSISCNGSDAAAIVVFVLGTAAIVFGLVMLIKSIKRKRQKSKSTS